MSDYDTFARVYAIPLSSIYCAYSLFLFISIIGMSAYYISNNAILSAYAYYFGFSTLLILAACIMNSLHNLLVTKQLKFMYSNDKYYNTINMTEMGLSCCGYTNQSNRHCRNRVKEFNELCDIAAYTQFKKQLILIQILNYVFLAVVIINFLDILFKLYKHHAESSISDSAYLARFVTVT